MFYLIGGYGSSLVYLQQDVTAPLDEIDELVSITVILDATNL